MTKKLLIPVFLCLVIIMSLMTTKGSTQILPPGDLSASNGYKAVTTQTISVVASSAQIIGTIPAGCYQVEVITDKDVNYGPSTVSTATSFPYIPAGTTKVFSGLQVRNPTIYFRLRGSETATATVGIVAK